MANALCFTPINFFHSTTKPLGHYLSAFPPISCFGESPTQNRIPTGCCLKAPKIHHVHVCIPKNVNFRMIVPKATARGTKPNSIVCADCDGNGAVLCSQCKGTGVNSVDHFNGQFKAGGICWLCSHSRSTCPQRLVLGFDVTLIRNSGHDPYLNKGPGTSEIKAPTFCIEFECYSFKFILTTISEVLGIYLQLFTQLPVVS
ncbi:hypothetical protein ACLOJK_020157 [Asimina triloba]